MLTHKARKFNGKGFCIAFFYDTMLYFYTLAKQYLSFLVGILVVRSIGRTKQQIQRIKLRIIFENYCCP